MHKVLAKQHFICFSIYLFIGVFGYLSFPVEDPNANSYIQRYDAIQHLPVLIVDFGKEGSRPADSGHIRRLAFQQPADARELRVHDMRQQQGRVLGIRPLPDCRLPARDGHRLRLHLHREQDQHGHNRRLLQHSQQHLRRPV